MKSTISVLLLTICALVCLYSCDKVVDVPKPNPNQIDPHDTGEMLLATLDYYDGVVEVHAKGLVWDSQQQTATIDVFLVNESNMPLGGPVLLSIININPETVGLMNPDGFTSDDLPYRKFDDEFGEDHVLSPQETSDSDMFAFYIGENGAFSIEFRLDSEIPSLGVISGVVFFDGNKNGIRDQGESGLEGFAVSLEFIDGDGIVHHKNTNTGVAGDYRFSNLHAAVYTVLLNVPGQAQLTTGNPLVITLLESGDGTVNDYNEADFGIDVEDLFLFYTFDDGVLPDWGGSAAMSIVSGALKLTAYNYADWRYHIYDWHNAGLYTKGTFEFEVKLGPSRSRFDMSGHTSGNLGDYNYGPVVYFSNGIIRVKTDSNPAYATAASYETNRWYRIRTEFDNGLGTRGRFSLYLKDLEAGDPERFVGEFDYYAAAGRLADIVQFGFVAFTDNHVYSASLYVDDVKLAVSR